jgi:hypothetical protein
MQRKNRLTTFTEIDSSNLSPADETWATWPDLDHNHSEIGRVRVTNLRTGEPILENNLVVLAGREKLLKKLVGQENGAEFNIRYFRVGSGGCDVGQTPSKIGPFDDDTDLFDPVPFSAGNSLDNGIYRYIHNGKSKLITADGGKIEIVDETHHISTIDSTGNQVFKDISAKTTVKFTMYVLADECNQNPNYPTRVFRFNEASLLMVNTEIGNPDVPFGATDAEKFNADSSIFARFTTLNKWLEASDDLMIEWFILV